MLLSGKAESNARATKSKLRDFGSTSFKTTADGGNEVAISRSLLQGDRLSSPEARGKLLRLVAANSFAYYSI